MNQTVSLPNWLRLHRQPPPPSPIPQAAKEVSQTAKELERFVAELRQINQTREAK